MLKNNYGDLNKVALCELRKTLFFQKILMKELQMFQKSQ
jgi:hypothetical protein